MPRQLLGGARVGLCHGLREELSPAFAMGSHGRLGGGGSGVAAVSGSAGSGAGKGCLYEKMPGELVKRVVELCAWEEEGLGNRWCG